MRELSSTPNACTSWKPCSMASSVRLSSLNTTPSSSRTSRFYSGSTTSGSGRDSFINRLHRMKPWKQTQERVASPPRRTARGRQMGSRSSEGGRHPLLLLIPLFTLFFLSTEAVASSLAPEMPTKCEACVISAKQLEESSLLIKKRTETTFIEWTESVCPRLLRLHLHKEKQGADRFQTEESPTKQTIKTLTDRGVKVDLGMPMELWDEPAAEVTHLKSLCEQQLAEHEEELEEWFFAQTTGGKGKSLQTVLCGPECSSISSEHSRGDL